MRPEDKELFDFIFNKEEIPEGYYSIAQIAEQTNLTPNAVAARMEDLCRKGQASKLYIRAGGLKPIRFFKVHNG